MSMIYFPAGSNLFSFLFLVDPRVVGWAHVSLNYPSAKN